VTGPQGLKPLSATRYLARLKPCPDEEKMPRFPVRATGTQAARKDPSLRLQLGPTLTKRGWGTLKTEADPCLRQAGLTDVCEQRSRVRDDGAFLCRVKGPCARFEPYRAR